MALALPRGRLRSKAAGPRSATGQTPPRARPSDQTWQHLPDWFGGRGGGGERLRCRPQETGAEGSVCGRLARGGRDGVNSAGAASAREGADCQRTVFGASTMVLLAAWPPPACQGRWFRHIATRPRRNAAPRTLSQRRHFAVWRLSRRLLPLCLLLLLPARGRPR
jgi:hypothetical protein